MPNTVQDFLADALKAAADLEAALLRLPADKRGWSPMGKARTALDQVAECAMLNGGMADLLHTRTMEGFDFAEYERAKAALAQDSDAAVSALRENTAKAAAAIRAVPDADLDIEIQLPWGRLTLRQIIAIPFWNMSYHEGQINYIASMLGCLE